MVVGLLGNESSDSNRFTLVTPKSENDVRLQATLGNQNPTGLPVGAVRIQGILGAFLVRVPVSYFMSIQPHPSLFHIGLATPFSSILELSLCLGYMIYLNKSGMLEDVKSRSYKHKV